MDLACGLGFSCRCGGEILEYDVVSLSQIKIHQQELR
jgi:hypothetical protein